MKWSRRVVALLLLGFGAFFLLAILIGKVDSPANGKTIGIVFLSAYFLVAVWWTVKVFSARVTLSAQSIDARDVFGQRQLALNAIRGRREYTVRGKTVTHYIKLVPDDDRIPAIVFEKHFNFDSTFYKWFYSLPDLDEADKKRSSFGLV